MGAGTASARLHNIDLTTSTNGLFQNFPKRCRNKTIFRRVSSVKLCA